MGFYGLVSLHPLTPPHYLSPRIWMDCLNQESSLNHTLSYRGQNVLFIWVRMSFMLRTINCICNEFLVDFSHCTPQDHLINWLTDF